MGEGPAAHPDAANAPLQPGKESRGDWRFRPVAEKLYAPLYHLFHFQAEATLRDRLRLLMPNLEYPPLGGGAAPVTRGLARALVARGHQVDGVTIGYRGLGFPPACIE